MENHPTISEDKLHKDVLNKIRENHKLEKCPVCKDELTKPTCLIGVPLYRGYKSTHEYKSCNKCQIIWKLEIFNWTNHRDDDMIMGAGHNLRLEGYSNCFCRKSIFEGMVYIENSKSGHSALGYPCPDAKKIK